MMRGDDKKLKVVERISQNLKEAQFLKVQKEKKEPTSQNGKWEYLSFDEANKVLEEGFNVGLVSGDKLKANPEAQEGEKIVCIDTDSLELSQYCLIEMPETYVEETTSGGLHFVYRTLNNFENKEIKWDNRHLGELRAQNSYIVIAPSRAKSKKTGEINSYQAFKDVPLGYLSDFNIAEMLKNFGMTNIKKAEGGVLSEDLLKKVQADEELNKLFEGNIEGFASRSEAEQSLSNKLRSRNFEKEEAYKIIANSKIGKLKEKPLSYWELMWEKSLNFVTSAKKEYIDRAQEVEPLQIMSILEVKKHKPSKEFLIKGIKYPSENEMIVAPSRSGKSLLCLYQACCLASGKAYLDKFKVKKSPVLVVLAETHKDWLQDKLPKILKGLKIKSNKIPLYFLTRDKAGDLMSLEFSSKVCKTIEQYKIKVLYLDTINPLTPEIDDNSARDVTRLFNYFLKPVIDGYGVNITYLHHTDKKGDQYLGSMKWFANSDQVFRLDRKELSPRITLYNEKNRRGETNTLDIEMLFTDKEIQFKLLSEKDPGVFNKRKKMTQQEFFILKLKEFFDEREDIERSEAMQIFKENKIKFSIPTFDRAWKEWRKEK